MYETTGYDARNATYKNGTFIAEDGIDLLALFKEKAKNGAGYELYSKRWLQYAKNGWKKENDLVLKIGFGLIDTPVRTGLRIVPVHEPDIAVDDLKRCPFWIVMF